MENKESQLNGLLDDALDDLLDDNEPTNNSSKLEEASDEKGIKLLETTGGNKKNKSKNIKKETIIPSTSSKDDVGFDEDEMNRFFENMTAQLREELPKIDPEEAQAKINESVPQIFDLMQNLLSKELLYPALKDLSPKFDEWLKKNKPTLSKDDKKRYEKQKAIINEIIEVFDDESLGNQERFEKNLDLMETMQSLGSPPEELTVPQEIGRCSVM